MSTSQCQISWQKTAHVDKPADIQELIVDNDIDILVLTETWIRDNITDSHALKELTPSGYKIHSVPRQGRRGGGLALLYPSTITVTFSDSKSYRSFELLTATVTQAQHSIKLYAIYRPPSGSSGVFMEDFADLVDSSTTSPGIPLLLGDFNIHVDSSSDPDTVKFMSLLSEANLEQHVKTPTHKGSLTI